jgi:seryl-tRNA synthetase
MLDIQILRADTAAVAARLADRGYTLDVAQFTALENERKAIQTETQDLQARRNALSKQIGQLKAKKEDASALMAEVNAQAEQLKTLEAKLENVQQRLSDFLMHVPNVPHASVPAGRDADANVEVRPSVSRANWTLKPRTMLILAKGWGFLTLKRRPRLPVRVLSS